jgi:hypothetical protein
VTAAEKGGVKHLLSSTVEEEGGGTDAEFSLLSETGKVPETGGENGGGEYSLEYSPQSHCDGRNSGEIEKALAGTEGLLVGGSPLEFCTSILLKFSCELSSSFLSESETGAVDLV